MYKLRKHRVFRALSRLMACFGVFAFIVTSALLPTQGYAQSVLNLPAPGTMITPSIGYSLPTMAGITIHPDNPLQFDFIITTGDDNLQGEEFRKESQKLINYFLATLTVPDDEMWVNLSPYEKDRIIADGLGTTEMGRDMLVQDYILKQFTASLMYPEEGLGEEFWNRVYEKSRAKFGTTEIPTDTFNKVWIIPEEAAVYVNGTNVFVSKSHLNVMLEEDYLALESNLDSSKHGLGKMTKDDIEVMSKEAKKVIREVILPEIEKEVNEGKNFANLRQIYQSMILATWYKKNLKESVLSKVYVDTNKVNGIDLEDKEIKEKIYNQYVEAFKKGVYNYIKEDYDPVTQEIIPRKYFSGGLAAAGKISEEKLSGSSPILKAINGDGRVERVNTRLDMITSNESVGSSPLSVVTRKEFTVPFDIQFVSTGASGRRTTDTKPYNLSGTTYELSDGRKVTSITTFPYRKGDHFDPNDGELALAGTYYFDGEFLQQRPLRRSSDGSKPVVPLQMKMSNGNLYELILTFDSQAGSLRGATINQEQIISQPGFAEVKTAVSNYNPSTSFPVEPGVTSAVDSTQQTTSQPSADDLSWTRISTKGLRDGKPASSSPVGAEEIATSKPGGIDFNPNNLDLIEQGQATNINFTNFPTIEPSTINGITPVIINITPISNFPLLLGFDTKSSNELMSSMDSDPPSDERCPDVPSSELIGACVGRDPEV